MGSDPFDKININGIKLSDPWNAYSKSKSNESTNFYPKFYLI
jgi:hypothetical protein